MAGDNNRLYFKNYERRPDDEEFAEVMKILKEEGAIISDKYIAPDCDWYQNCTIGEGVFEHSSSRQSPSFFDACSMELFSIQKVAKR